jgi:MoaA/NifB/PqqE/SkfB family radical SAM enzyme
MTYTPKLSFYSSEMVRRISWAFSLPMTKTIEHIIKCFPLLVDSALVCDKCENRKICACCIFSPHYELKGDAAKALDKVTAA